MNFTKRSPLAFSKGLETMDGISKKTVEEHMKLYTGYVNKYNEIREKLNGLTEEDLTKANQAYSLIRELKVELTFAWGGIVNHEMYFSHLGGKGGMPQGDLMAQIKSDFGSFEKYVKDLKATGISARGWVWTAWNYEENSLFNYLGDAQNSYPVWGAKPILALDTYEHAYFIDYGANRGSYIDTFMKNLDWKVIEETFARVTAPGCQCG